MSGFTLCRNRAESRLTYPYLIDVQSPLLSDLKTRLVIPVACLSGFGNKSIKILNPVIRLKMEDFIVLTQQMAAVPAECLGEKELDLNKERSEILAAIDFLITGF